MPPRPWSRDELKGDAEDPPNGVLNKLLPPPEGMPPPGGMPPPSGWLFGPRRLPMAMGLVLALGGSSSPSKLDGSNPVPGVI
jgi:hypothetical protein